MAESTWADPNFQAWAKDKFVLVKLNANENEGIREQFNVAGLPTVILSNPDGQEIDRTLGFIRTSTFVDTVTGYQKGIGTLQTMLSNEEGMASDLNYVKALGDKLYAHRRWDDADERYAAVIKADADDSKSFGSKAQLQRAIMAGRQDNFSLATMFCKSLVEKWPQSEIVPEATIYVGYYSAKGGQNEDAIAAYKEYLESWPDGEDAEFATKQLAKLESPEDSTE